MKFKVEKKIFIPAAVVLIAFILYGAIAPDSFAVVTTAVKSWMGTNFAWFALGMAAFMVLVFIIMAASPFGKTKMGGEKAQVEYKTFTWIAMVLCGNIGIAMMFYAVTEPIGFFTDPPAFWGLAAGSDAAAEHAIAQSTFHWGAVTWVIDIFGGFLGVYLCMNEGLPFRPSSSLYPVLKEKAFGPIGTVYDVIALIGIIGGIVTGFGFGVLQFTTGLSYTTGKEVNNWWYLITVLVVIVVLAFSSKGGLKKGMAKISNLNAYIYLAILAFLFVVGPTRRLLELLVGSSGSFIENFVQMTFNGDFLGEGNGWNVDYTAFTWFWGFVYGPFTGMFLAKISRGRTVRQFLAAVLIVPTVFMLVWFCFWGGNAINLQAVMGIDLMTTINEWGVPVANFVTLKNLPLAVVMIPLVLICILIGFITLVDALANTIAAMCVKEVRSDLDASPVLRIFWVCILGAATLVCLFVVGDVGMGALQSLTITLGVPLSFCTIAIAIGMFRVIKGETQKYIHSRAGKDGFKEAGIRLIVDEGDPEKAAALAAETEEK